MNASGHYNANYFVLRMELVELFYINLLLASLTAIFNGNQINTRTK